MKNSLTLFTIALCVFLVISVVLLGKAIRQYRTLSMELDSLNGVLRLATERYSQAQKAIRIMARVRRFVGKARALGLAPEEWQSYEVSVKEPLMFEEIQEILGQTVSGQGHFFMPLSLTLLRPKEIHEVPETSEKKKGDLLVEIQGRFLVRAR